MIIHPLFGGYAIHLSIIHHFLQQRRWKMFNELVKNHTNFTTDQIKAVQQFLLLSPKQQHIFRVLVYYSKNLAQVFPALETIAKHVGCSVRTVTRCIAHFFKLGWLTWRKRAYRSNLYYIKAELLKIDWSSNALGYIAIPENQPIKVETAKVKAQKSKPQDKKNVQQDVQQDVHVLDVTNYKDIYKRKDVSKDGKGEGKGKAAIPPEIDKLPIAQEDKYKLLRFPMAIIVEAIQDCMNYAKYVAKKSNAKIKSFFGLLITRIHLCMRIRKEKQLMQQELDRHRELKEGIEITVDEAPEIVANRSKATRLKAYLKMKGAGNRIEVNHNCVIIFADKNQARGFSEVYYNQPIEDFNLELDKTYLRHYPKKSEEPKQHQQPQLGFA